MSSPLSPPAPAALGRPATPSRASTPGIGWRVAVLSAAGAITSFHVAFLFSHLSGLVVLFVFGLTQLSGLRTARQAFYAGMGVGYAIYAPQLAFFWGIFGWPAIILWGILALWLGLFTASVRSFRIRWGRMAAALAIPFLWTGIEYFRSELYYLRFSWLSLGYAFSESPQIFRATGLGVYGVGFVVAGVAAAATLLPRKGAFGLLAGAVLLLATIPLWSVGRAAPPGRGLQVAGVQMEFPAPQEVPGVLDRVLREHPDTDLLVLSEYSFDGPVPERVKAWCRRNQRHLVAGGKETLAGGGFHNTAFVVGPDGTIVFQKAKSVPIQFFKDGQPATTRRPWNSPWGKLGICICYDLSYRRVVDDLVRQGIRALIVPTMDVADWGEAQHRLHARIAPVRAAEYGLPVVRVCSSGISQVVDARGCVRASAPCPGQEAILAGALDLGSPGRLPADRYLGPAASGLSAAVWAALLWVNLNQKARALFGQRAREETR